MVGRLGPGGDRHRQSARGRPRARHRRRVRDPGVGHHAHRRGTGPRPGHRLRDPGPSRLATRATRWSPPTFRAARSRSRSSTADSIARRRAWDLRHGSLLEPVAGEQFDLVVSNPPFVITPPGAPELRVPRRRPGRRRHLPHPGVRASARCWRPAASRRCSATGRCTRVRTGGRGSSSGWTSRRLAAGRMDHPARRARCGRICRDVAARRGSGSRARPRGVRRGLRGVPERLRGARRGGVGFGIVTLRRAEGEVTLRRLEEHEGDGAAAGTAHRRVLAAHDWLVTRSDDEVLGERWVVAPTSRGRPTGGRRWRPGAHSDPPGGGSAGRSRPTRRWRALWAHAMASSRAGRSRPRCRAAGRGPAAWRRAWRRGAGSWRGTECCCAGSACGRANARSGPYGPGPRRLGA